MEYLGSDVNPFLYSSSPITREFSSLKPKLYHPEYLYLGISSPTSSTFGIFPVCFSSASKTFNS